MCQHFVKNQHGASLSRPVSEANTRTGIDSNKHVADSHDFTDLPSADATGCRPVLSTGAVVTASIGVIPQYIRFAAQP